MVQRYLLILFGILLCVCAVSASDAKEDALLLASGSAGSMASEGRIEIELVGDEAAGSPVGAHAEAEGDPVSDPWARMAEAIECGLMRLDPDKGTADNPLMEVLIGVHRPLVIRYARDAPRKTEDMCVAALNSAYVGGHLDHVCEMLRIFVDRGIKVEELPGPNVWFSLCHVPSVLRERLSDLSFVAMLVACRDAYMIRFVHSLRPGVEAVLAQVGPQSQLVSPHYHARLAGVWLRGERAGGKLDEVLTVEDKTNIITRLTAETVEALTLVGASDGMGSVASEDA